MSLPRFNSLIALVAIIAMLAAAGYFAWQYIELRRENNELTRNKEQLSQRYAEQSDKLRENQRILERLRTDPEYVEMIIRRRLGYAKAGELIYNFETPPADSSTQVTPISSDTAAPQPAPLQPRQPLR